MPRCSTLPCENVRRSRTIWRTRFAPSTACCSDRASAAEPSAAHGRQLLDRVVAGARGPEAPEHVLEVHEQVREGVVDLVRDARRERPERRHSLALQELMLELDPLGHVARDDDHGRRPVEVDRGGRGLRRPVAAPLAEPAQAERLVRRVRRRAPGPSTPRPRGPRRGTRRRWAPPRRSSADGSPSARTAAGFT